MLAAEEAQPGLEEEEVCAWWLLHLSLAGVKCFCSSLVPGINPEGGEAETALGGDSLPPAPEQQLDGEDRQVRCFRASLYFAVGIILKIKNLIYETRTARHSLKQVLAIFS